MTNLTATKPRIQSIDILRGLVMIIMALDHVRDYFHVTAMTDDPMNFNTTTPQLFFTRWITHFCAPVFVFLAGTSVYLMSLRKTKAEVSSFLIKRGLWLIAVEVLIISLAWSFDPLYHFFFLQVIWAIGISMVVLGLLVRLPYKVLFTIGLAIVLGHNLLDYPESANVGKTGFLWDLLHAGRFSAHPLFAGRFILVVYPFVPWLGLMIMGFCFGKLYAPSVEATVRRKYLLQMGFGLIALFVLLRFINAYGDPYPWATQKNALYTFFSFLNIHKYPPSLMYMCITIGPAMIFLALIEKVQNRLTDIFNIFGRVPMFYYILHLYFIHVLCAIMFFVEGHTIKDAYSKQAPFGFRPAVFGYNLWVVFAIWLFVIVVLYPLCKRYDRYKSTHKYWWLSYL
jgi:uncharacterized membrane protein